LQFPQAGSVVVAGSPVTAPVKISGMAFQNPTLLPWRTTLDNLLLPLEIVQPHRSRIRRHRDEYVARAEALLEQVGLRGMGQKFPWQLSGGMQQRASLCRALIHEPQLLLLDEPFGALDAITRADLCQWLAAALAADPRTVLVVTHDVEEAAFLADRIVVLSPRPGRVVADFEVDLPRPRSVTSPEFTQLKARALEALHS
jgi:NitT/TauT family transport system ATP-binding protein